MATTDDLIAELNELRARTNGYISPSCDYRLDAVRRRGDPNELRRTIAELKAVPVPDEVTPIASAQDFASDLWPEMVEESRQITKRIFCNLDDIRALLADTRIALDEAPGIVEAQGYIVVALAEQDMSADGEIAEMIRDLGRVQTALARWDGAAHVNVAPRPAQTPAANTADATLNTMIEGSQEVDPWTP